MRYLHCGSYCTPTVNLPILLTSHALVGHLSAAAKYGTSITKRYFSHILMYVQLVIDHAMLNSDPNLQKTNEANIGRRRIIIS